jgi:hypothetical protein
MAWKWSGRGKDGTSSDAGNSLGDDGSNHEYNNNIRDGGSQGYSQEVLRTPNKKSEGFPKYHDQQS